MNPINFGRHSIGAPDVEAVSRTLQGDFLTAGPCVKEFEQELKNLTGAKYAVACSSGTAALHLACLALEIHQGDWGLSSPLTFVASANCIEYCSGSVDFIDIDSKTLCISPLALREYCENVRVPKVVIAVDFAGVPASTAELFALSKEFNFKLVIDCAHSLGSSYLCKGQQIQCGSCEHSDFSVFSFHPLKNITTGEGGALLTNNQMLAERAQKFRSHGLERDIRQMTNPDGPWCYELSSLGFNYRLTDFQCALGISQLKQLEKFKIQRRSLVEHYNNRLGTCENIILPTPSKDSFPCFHLYPIQLNGDSNLRLQVYNELERRGIRTQVHYIPVHSQPYYRNKYGYGIGKCPAAELYYSRCLSLPLHVGLTIGDIDKVSDALLEIVK